MVEQARTPFTVDPVTISYGEVKMPTFSKEEMVTTYWSEDEEETRFTEKMEMM